MIHLKRLCSYLKRFQTIYRMGRLTKMVKLKGTNSATGKTFKHKIPQNFFFCSEVLNQSRQFIWLSLCLKRKGGRGVGWGANSIDITCIRLRSTLLSSVEHMNKNLHPNLQLVNERGLIFPVMQNFKLKNTNSAED